MSLSDVATNAGLQIAASRLLASQYPITDVSTDNGALTTWDGEPAAYDHWQCLNEYIDEPGVVVLPTSDPNGNNVKVVYGSRSITLIRRWAAKRTGAPPRFPPPVVMSADDPSQVDNNWVYIGGDGPQVRELGIAANGVSIVYEASGTYVFQAIDPKQVKYLASVPPALSSPEMLSVVKWANTPDPPPSAVAVQSIVDGVGTNIAQIVVNAPNNTLGQTQLSPPGR